MNAQTIKKEKEDAREVLKNCFFECNHLRTETRKLITKNNQIQIREQCVFCGSSISDPIPKSKFTESELLNMPLYDRDLRDRRSELYTKVYGVLSQHIDMKYGGSFWERYERHMTSDNWYQKREVVIDRAKNKCELCGIRPIQHIHHKSYDQFGNEPLEDLLGVCITCHQKLHS